MSEPEHVAVTRQVYDHSAALYAEAVGTVVSPAFETSLDTGILEVFAKDVLISGGGSVLDIGCGPGRVTAFLADRGFPVSGIDLSPAMIETARHAHPSLQFEIGSLTDLGVADRSLAGAVLWYSIIHTPPARLGSVWTELERALAPGGRALIGFQSGDNEQIERTDAYGSAATLRRYHHDLDDVVPASRLLVSPSRPRSGVPPNLGTKPPRNRSCWRNRSSWCLPRQTKRDMRRRLASLARRS